MPIPPEAIIKLAEQTGFDSELRAASVARQAGFSVRQSVYYYDKDESKGRELDLQVVTIAIELSGEPKVWCSIELSAEIKKTKEPFIFFTSERERVERGEGYAIIRFLHNIDAHKFLPRAELDRNKPLRKPARIARSYVGAKSLGGQQIQSGVLSAVKAALHAHAECEEIQNETSRDIVIFVPMLVVDGPLCECYLDEKTNELRASEVQELVYLQNYISDSYGDLSHQVIVVTMARFATILPMFKNWAESVRDALIKTRHNEAEKPSELD